MGRHLVLLTPEEVAGYLHVRPDKTTRVEKHFAKAFLARLRASTSPTHHIRAPPPSSNLRCYSNICVFSQEEQNCGLYRSASLFSRPCGVWSMGFSRGFPLLQSMHTGIWTCQQRGTPMVVRMWKPSSQHMRHMLR